MIYLKTNVGFWQFGDRLFLDVYVPLLFASIVDTLYIYFFPTMRSFFFIGHFVPAC